MTNLIQIKRSINNATVPDLNPGELAFTHASDVLYVGNPDVGNNTVKNIRIGGYQTPGILRANQALVANGSSAIDKVIAAELQTNVINLSQGGKGTAGYVLTSNGDNPAYWQSIASLGIDSTANFSWSGKHSFAGNVNVTAAQINVAKLVTGTNGYNVAGDTSAGGVTVNTTIIGIGNSSLKSSVNTTYVVISGNFGTDVGDGESKTGGAVINTTAIAFGNVSQQSILTSKSLAVGNIAADDATGGSSVNNSVIVVGNSTIRTQINSTAFTGTANNTAYVGVTAASSIVNSAQLSSNLANYAAATYVNTKAGDAYTNAMADTLSRNGSYTGNNTFSANLTTFSGNNINFTTNNTIYVKDKASIRFGNISDGSTNMAISGNLVSGLNSFRNHGMAIAMGSSGAGAGGVQEFAPLGNLLSGNSFFVNTSILQIGSMINDSNGTYTNVVGGTIILNSSDGNRATINSTAYSGTIPTANNANYLGTIAACNYFQVGDSKVLTGNLFLSGANNTIDSARYRTIKGAGVLESITGVVISGTAGQFTCSGCSLAVNDIVTITGTLTGATIQGYSSPSYYKVASKTGTAPNVTGFTLQQTDGTALVTTTGTPSGVTFAATEFTATNTNITANTLVIESSIVTIDSANVSMRNLAISGNLSVSGTLTTIDTNNLVIKDSSLKLAEDQANSSSFTDALDFGVYGAFGANTSGNTYYSGLIRDHALSSNTNSIWKLFSTNTQPGSTTDFTLAGSNMSTLKAYLQTNGQFTVNSTTVAITANASINVAIVANTLTLSTALASTSGGTGNNEVNPGDMIIGSATTGTTLTVTSVGTAGYFTCSPAAITNNDLITVSGIFTGDATLTGYSNATTYRVINIVTGTYPTVTAFQLKTLSGAVFNTASGTLTGLTFNIRKNSGTYEKLQLGNAGYVLQSNGTALTYDILDGGTF